MVIIALVFLGLVLMCTAVVYETRLMRRLWAARKKINMILHGVGQLVLAGTLLYSLFAIFYTVLHVILSLVKPEYFDQNNVLATAMLGWIAMIMINSVILLWTVPIYTWATYAKDLPTTRMKINALVKSVAITILLCGLLGLGIWDFFQGDRGLLITLNYWPG